MLPSYYFVLLPRFVLSSHPPLSTVQLCDFPALCPACHYHYQFPPRAISPPAFCFPFSILQFGSELFQVSPLVGTTFPICIFHRSTSHCLPIEPSHFHN